MKDIRARRVKVGIFLIAALAALTVGLLVLGGVRWWHHGDGYYAGFRGGVSGLGAGAEVKVRGVTVGEVTKVELVDNPTYPVRVSFEVAKGTPIHPGARAVLVRVGITDLRFLDIRGGDLSTKRLKPGSTLPGEGEVLERFAQRAEVLATRVDGLLTRLEVLTDNLIEMTNPENRARVTSLLAHLDSAAERIDKGAGEAQALLHDGRDAVAQARRRVGKTSDAIDRLISDAASLVASGRRTVELGGADARRALRDLREAARDLKELGRELRREPSRLLFGKPPPERKLP